jgi:hypothetical protein
LYLGAGDLISRYLMSIRMDDLIVAELSNQCYDNIVLKDKCCFIQFKQSKWHLFAFIDLSDIL